MADYREKLRALVDASNLTISDLADASGMKRTTLNNMLSPGSRNRPSSWTYRLVIRGITRRAGELASLAAAATDELLIEEERIRAELL